MPSSLKPSFIIIGGVKCGTSSLYRYLNEHPNILPCKIKELNYFNSRNPARWLLKRNWYFSQFPRKDFLGTIEADWLELNDSGRYDSQIFTKEKKANIKYITGEATASIIARGFPRFLRYMLPDVKLIIMLRDPIEKFISHYNMLDRFKKEGRKKYSHLETLDEFVIKEINLYLSNKKTKVIHRGIYAELLDRWYSCFDTNNIKIIKTQKLSSSASAQKELSSLFEFLGIKDFKLSSLDTIYNMGVKKTSSTRAKKLLEDFYQPYNERLFQRYAIKF